MAPDTPETLENFKKSIGSLKDVASDIITQVRFLSDLATDISRDAGFVAKQFDNAFNKWQQSNGESGETNQEVNNDAAAEGNSNEVPQEAWNALNKQNRKAAIAGVAQKAGNGIKNLGGKIKTFFTRDPNRMHHVWVQDPTGKDPKFGTQDGVTIEMPEKSLQNFINSNKQKGFVVTALDYDTSFIGIDEDGNQHKITMEEFSELCSDAEVITEQDYLMYYQFENITSLEF
jgi:hypothetical protein